MPATAPWRARAACAMRSCVRPAMCTASVLAPTPGRAPRISTLRCSPPEPPPMRRLETSRCTTPCTSSGETDGSTKSLTPARKAAMAPSGWAR
ncbi:Uncharacterised protein [Bordetella pertussis]|nr:Uncharacterised protein [Bordetella pertussis]